MGRIPTTRKERSPRIFGASALASVVCHAVLAASWVALVKGPAAPTTANVGALGSSRDVPVELDLPRGSVKLLDALSLPDPEGIPPVPVAGAMTPQLDDGSRGRGGEGRRVESATNLADRDEALHVSPDLENHLDRDQVQRIRTARERTAWEDRRATTHPMELTFVAIGHGQTMDRRPKSEVDPSRGLRHAEAPDAFGGRSGSVEEPSPAPIVRAGDESSTSGRRDPAPGLGLTNRAPGPDHRNAAAVAEVRPSVTMGRTTVPATAIARPNDTVDSEQEVSNLVRSLVHASATGGARGEGRGGSTGEGDPGAGGERGTGSRSSPMGLGLGDPIDFGTQDPRLLAYFRKLHAKIDPEWKNAFPTEALLAMRQGTVILDFVVSESGAARVVWPPTRASGVAEFDANCAAAIKRAGPFEPIPRELGVRELRVRAPFVASNPIVR